MATSLIDPAQLPAAERLHAMGSDRRAAAYLSGDLDRHGLHVWAALSPGTSAASSSDPVQPALARAIKHA